MNLMNSIGTTIKYRLTETLSNMQADKLYQGLDECIHVYNHSGHTVT